MKNEEALTCPACGSSLFKEITINQYSTRPVPIGCPGGTIKPADGSPVPCLVLECVRCGNLRLPVYDTALQAYYVVEMVQELQKLIDELNNAK